MGRDPKKRSAGLNLALVLISVLVVLGTTEVVLSSLAPEDYMRTPARQPEDDWIERIHQPSEIAGLDFELSPNRQKKIEGVWVRTNSFGMRGAEPQAAHDQSVRRIVTLGDSFTFGFRVPVEAAYPDALEQQLNLNPEAPRVEVLNFGVCGYTTRDEATVLRSKAMHWDPELVIVGYVLNDPEIDPVQPLTSYFQNPAWWQRFDVMRRLAKLKNVLSIKFRGGGDYVRYLHSPGHPKWRSVEAGFDDIRQATEKAGVPVLLVIFPDNYWDKWSTYPYEDIHLQVAEAARARGFDVLDLYETYSGYSPRELRVRRRDPHPSVMGHGVTATAIAEWIAGKGQDPTPSG